LSSFDCIYGALMVRPLTRNSVSLFNPPFTGSVSGIVGSGGNVGIFHHVWPDYWIILDHKRLCLRHGETGLVWRISVVAEESSKSTLADGSASKQAAKRLSPLERKRTKRFRQFRLGCTNGRHTRS
jgi:hypothetical protein